MRVRVKELKEYVGISRVLDGGNYSDDWYLENYSEYGYRIFDAKLSEYKMINYGNGEVGMLKYDVLLKKEYDLYDTSTTDIYILDIDGKEVLFRSEFLEFMVI